MFIFLTYFILFFFYHHYPLCAIFHLYPCPPPAITTLLSMPMSSLSFFLIYPVPPPASSRPLPALSACSLSVSLSLFFLFITLLFLRWLYVYIPFVTTGLNAADFSHDLHFWYGLKGFVDLKRQVSFIDKMEKTFPKVREH